MITRDQRQAITHEKIIAAKGRGYLNCCGSYGKTRVAINFIKHVQTLRPSYDVTVVVPTLGLRDQWIIELDKREVTNYEVLVINSATNTDKEITSKITIVDRLCPL